MFTFIYIHLASFVVVYSVGRNALFEMQLSKVNICLNADNFQKRGGGVLKYQLVSIEVNYTKNG